MNKLKAIIIASETDSRISGKHLLENENFAISSYVECKSDSFLKINGIYPDVVLCIDEGNDLIFELARRIYVSMPGVLLVMATDKYTENYKDSTVELGFHIITDLSAEPDEFFKRVSRLNSIEKKRLTDDQRKIRNAEVISVYSAKGGCGKTFAAINLAFTAAQNKKKTLIIDGSLNFGDVCLYLDINSKDTIAELVQEGSNITIDTINNFTVLHNSGLNVLPAPKSPEYAEYITEDHIEKLLSILRPYYEVIIIDLPVTLNNTTIAAIENSDIVLYISALDIASLKDMYLVQKIMQSLQQISKFQTVLNRVGKDTLSIKQFKKNTAFPLVGLLHEERNVPKSLEIGTPISGYQKKSKISSDFTSLYNSVIKEKD